MPDITKCKGENCPFRDKCYRYNSKDNYWQSYFMNTPIDLETEECSYYWPMQDDPMAKRIWGNSNSNKD